MPRKQPKDVIADIIPASMIRSRKRYSEELPGYLAPWYLYLTGDGTGAGHMVLVALASAYQPGGDPAHFLVPVPVRTVLRLGWERTPDGFAVVALPHEPGYGVIVPDSDHGH